MGIEYLVKLNPKTARLEMVGFGKGLISWEDVAAALAGLPVQCTWFAYASLETHSNDAPGIKQRYTGLLRDYLAGLIWSEMLAREYQPRSKTIGEMSQGIAKAVLHARLNSAGHCNRCNGKGWVILDGAKTDCKICGGHGDAEFSNSEKYAIAFGGVVAEKERKFYQHQCQVYDQYANSKLSEIIVRITEKFAEVFKYDGML